MECEITCMRTSSSSSSSSSLLLCLDSVAAPLLSFCDAKKIYTRRTHVGSTSVSNISSAFNVLFCDYVSANLHLSLIVCAHGFNFFIFVVAYHLLLRIIHSTIIISSN
mmetsp:Transcript_1381/g.1864  ORF Transcript_1381/g.1864 Transcript_1381/m.1864 type:complete len:108 (+) Transcript_1381:444-767(+)